MPGTVLIDPLFQPDLWTDDNAESPPAAWEAYEEGSETFYFGGEPLDNTGDNIVNYTGPGQLPNQLGFAWEITEVSPTAVLFRYVNRYGETITHNLGTAIDAGTIAISDFDVDPDGDEPFSWWITDQAGEGSNAPPVAVIAVRGCDVSYNCECETDPNARTLVSLREELLMRTGYAAQIARPPPGIAQLYNSYLRSAQEYLYRRYKALQTLRFFSWRLREGYRYYGLRDNEQCCDVKLDRYRIQGAWVQDPNNTWWPLVRGIDPTFYTLDLNLGWPNYFDIRQCIEVFPAPMAGGYKLWLKGNFGLLPFAADTDVTTIDAEPVLLWAIGLAKSHKGDRDAGLPIPAQETGYYGMAIRYVKDLIASSHGNKRYIPGSAAIPIPTPPVMVHFDG